MDFLGATVGTTPKTAGKLKIPSKHAVSILADLLKKLVVPGI